jgi:hypothetical protein
MNLWGGKVVGGRARAGEFTGRAVLLVPIDGLWELHDLPWDRPGDECDDSYWDDDEGTSKAAENWLIEWVETSKIRDFIAQHFADLDADDLAAKAL